MFQGNLACQHLLPSYPSHRGGKICLTDHFKPLWARNVPKFGLAHLMALGVSLGYLLLPPSPAPLSLSQKSIGI